jgi:hypothetical protein
MEKNKMEQKSDDKLRRIITQLKERGVEAARHEQQPIVADFLDLVGELTLYEIHKLVEIAVDDHNAAISGNSSRRMMPRVDLDSGRLRLRPDCSPPAPPVAIVDGAGGEAGQGAKGGVRDVVDCPVRYRHGRVRPAAQSSTPRAVRRLTERPLAARPCPAWAGGADHSPGAHGVSVHDD